MSRNTLFLVAVVPQLFPILRHYPFSFLYARRLLPFLLKRYCSGLGDPVGACGGSSTSSRGTGRGGSLLSTGGTAAGGKKDRIPNHWWELELTAEGPMLYPTSNCHEWTSDNGIEHRIMEIEFQHGCEVGEGEEMRHLLFFQCKIG